MKKIGGIGNTAGSNSSSNKIRGMDLRRMSRTKQRQVLALGTGSHSSVYLASLRQDHNLK